jgi:hypothetical protein
VRRRCTRARAIEISKLRFFSRQNVDGTEFAGKHAIKAAQAAKQTKIELRRGKSV